MALTGRRQAFVDEYLKTRNASEAARRAGYTGRANTIGPRLLANVVIAAEIARRTAEKAMEADEVLARLADMARADLGEFIDESGQFDVLAMKQANATHLLHKFKRTDRSGVSPAGGSWDETRIEVELYDAQAALVHIGKYHGLFDKGPAGTEDDPYHVKVIEGPKDVR